MNEQWSGHVCVPHSSQQDFASLLGSEHWKSHFDFATINLDTWNRLEQLRFWDSLNQQLSTLIDLYEEEWIEPENLDGFLVLIQDHLKKHEQMKDRLVADEKVDIFLHELSALATLAKNRSTPLIFSF